MKKFIYCPFILLCFMFFVSCEDTSTPKISTAAVMAQEIVKQKMSYPEEVDFEWDIRGSGDATNGFTVYQKFTAPNAFGVKKEFIYKCQIKYLGGDKYEDDSWECISITIEDIHTGKQWH